MQMNIRFELQPKQRPKLAEAIAAALHTIPCYQKAPSLSYKIGDCTLEKDGTLRIPDTVDTETVNALLTHLQEKGFTGTDGGNRGQADCNRTKGYLHGYGTCQFAKNHRQQERTASEGIPYRESGTGYHGGYHRLCMVSVYYRAG